MEGIQAPSLNALNAPVPERAPTPWRSPVAHWNGAAIDRAIPATEGCTRSGTISRDRRSLFRGCVDVWNRDQALSIEGPGAEKTDLYMHFKAVSAGGRCVGGIRVASAWSWSSAETLNTTQGLTFAARPRSTIQTHPGRVQAWFDSSWSSSRKTLSEAWTRWSSSKGGTSIAAERLRISAAASPFASAGRRSNDSSRTSTGLGMSIETLLIIASQWFARRFPRLAWRRLCPRRGLGRGVLVVPAADKTRRAVAPSRTTPQVPQPRSARTGMKRPWPTGCAPSSPLPG